VFTEPVRLGGAMVSAEVLNKGERGYRRYCVPCHGRNGDGHGPSANAMNPPPRDFTSGLFRYKSTPGDLLPTDDDLLTTIRQGSPGTRMNGFDGLADDELYAIVQYLKTFSERWSAVDSER